MTDQSDVPALDAPPDAETIADLRDRAAAHDESVEVTFPTADNDTKRFVVSPRGTCVVLANTREDSFTPSVAAGDIAVALRE